MNPRNTEPAENLTPRRPEKRRSNGVLFSLTSIFFVFGILLAFGVRSIEAVRQSERDKVASRVEEQKQLDQMQRNLAREEKERKGLQTRIALYEKQIASGAKMSKEQALKMSTELKKVQTLLGLTAVKGPGITIRLADNAQASSNAGPDASSFLPGIVHDFDLLQVVNELRSAKAEAIAINGVRITGFTPIRCVGPVIYINYEPKPAPFEVEAIGDSDDLMNALSMPGGIIENLKNQTLNIRIRESDSLSLPATTSLGVPELKLAKPQQ